VAASLTVAHGATHRIADLPGMPLGSPDPSRPASELVTGYYGAFEEKLSLAVRRPVHVISVSSPDRPDGSLVVATDAGTWRTSTLVSATGTWDRPHWPSHPGRETFRGRQLHTHDFRSADEFRRQQVVVGGGTSAVQFLLQLSAAGATTTWVTRRPVEFVERPFGPEWGERSSAWWMSGWPPVCHPGASSRPRVYR